jgi:hypothetical protein
VKNYKVPFGQSQPIEVIEMNSLHLHANCRLNAFVTEQPSLMIICGLLEAVALIINNNAQMPFT